MNKNVVLALGVFVELAVALIIHDYMVLSETSETQDSIIVEMGGNPYLK